MALEIDLSNGNAEKLREIFAPYVAATRRGDGQRARRPQRLSTGSTARPSRPSRLTRRTRADRGRRLRDRGWRGERLRIGRFLGLGFRVWAGGLFWAVLSLAYPTRGAGAGAAAKPGLPKVADPFTVSFT